MDLVSANPSYYHAFSQQMPRLNGISANQTFDNADYLLEILSFDQAGSWEVSLPPVLKAYQTELEGLLGKVFTNRPMLPENQALAQQMSINWCVYKCREVGLTLEER